MSIYCFDLDGTLGYSTGTDYEATTPYPERIAQVNRLYDAGHTILIDSARGSVTGRDWSDFTKQQLTAWGLKYHQVRTGIKFFADVYVDDKSASELQFFHATD